MTQTLTGVAIEERGQAEGLDREPSLDVSVVVPVVTRADDLVEIYRVHGRQLDEAGAKYEFIFVFDGSYGDVPGELLALAERDDRIRIFRFHQAFGETAALRAGFDRSRGEFILTLSPYFQVEVEGVRGVLDELERGTEVVVTRRWPRQDGWLNRLQTRAFHGLVGLATGHSFRDSACGLRGFRRDAASQIPLYGDLHRFIPTLALREGLSVQEIDVPQHENESATRLYSPGVYLRRLLDVVTLFFLVKFTEKPLRFFGLVGTGLAGLGGVLGLVLLGQKLAGKGIADRPLLLLSVLLVAVGIQFVGLGLVGEIIVHFRASRDRQYRVRRVS